MGKKQKIKKETWLVFYRDKRGKLNSMEVNGSMTKEDAIAFVSEEKKLAPVYTDGFSYLEWGLNGPIVKKLVYV